MGGWCIGECGYFYVFMLLVDVLLMVCVMQEEFFGLVVVVMFFVYIVQVLVMVNVLFLGLVFYVFMQLLVMVYEVVSGLQVGMVNINYFGMVYFELFFGGIGESGFGSEGGIESFDSFLVIKMISQISYVFG